MEKRASLILGVPTTPIEGFFVGGYCPRDQLAQPVRIAFWLGESKLGEVVVGIDNPSFEALFAVPPAVLGSREVLVRIVADRALVTSVDRRELAVAFGRIGFR